MSQRRIFTRLVRLVAAGAAVSLSLSACGSDTNTTGTTAIATNTTCVTAAVNGSGSTFAQNIVKEWIKNYGAACPQASINYQGGGSSTGVANFTSKTVDFAGSDVTLTEKEKPAAEAANGPVLEIPWTAGAVALMYNLPGVDSLQLQPNTLAKIYTGTITKWDDPAIAADNPGANLPSLGVQVVHRADGSGTTAVLTEFLQASAGPVWKAGTGKEVKWPTGQGVQKSDKLTETVKATPGAIGYAELSYAVGAQLKTVKIGNAGGAYVAPDAPGAVAAALNQATIGPDLQVKANYQASDAAAYPLSSVSYVLVPHKVGDANKAALLREFITYAVGQGQDSAVALSYAPLPPSLAQKAKTAAATIAGP